MAQASTFSTSKRVAVVTGSNKGIGFEACKQLASKGITVVVTARDEKRGFEAIEELKGINGLSELLVFRQLDVADSSSIVSLADFITTQFGKLDTLVNNAGISGSVMDPAAMARAVETDSGWVSSFERMSLMKPLQTDWNKIMIQTYELAEQCLKINYYGSKGMAEAFLPLLKLSTSPRIVNVSSCLGLLSVQACILIT